MPPHPRLGAGVHCITKCDEESIKMTAESIHAPPRCTYLFVILFSTSLSLQITEINAYEISCSSDPLMWWKFHVEVVLCFLRGDWS
jgi:hypothetical protein